MNKLIEYHLDHFSNNWDTHPRHCPRNSRHGFRNIHRHGNNHLARRMSHPRAPHTVPYMFHGRNV